MAINHQERHRIGRPEIDSLSVVQAAEVLIHGLDSVTEPESVVARVCTSGLVIGIRHIRERSTGLAVPSRLRIVERANPFNAMAGIEIRLPHAERRKQAGVTADVNPDRSASGAFASYPYDGMSWNDHRLRNDDATPFRLHQTVEQFDDILERGRTGAPDEWVGFYLAGIVEEILSPASEVTHQ